MKACAIIPVYNHGKAISAVVQALLAHGLHCVLVDDGSSADCATVLAALAAHHPEQITLQRLTVNQGKGGAMLAGFRVAAEAGFSHGLQIDADGQHDTASIPAFLATAAAHPDALICGYPVYDESVPKIRLYGRYLTHIWVWINTLSFAIRDGMCGQRLYPLTTTLALIDSVAICRRMDFDTDIAVRLVWRRVPVINLPTRVHYPSDGVSHFDVWRDNIRITRMHTVLFFGMLRRLPRLLAKRAAP